MTLRVRQVHTTDEEGDLWNCIIVINNISETDQ